MAETASTSRHGLDDEITEMALGTDLEKPVSEITEIAAVGNGSAIVERDLAEANADAADSPRRTALSQGLINFIERIAVLAYLAIILLIAISVALWKSLSTLHTQRMKDCPPNSGNLDTYGIGIRVATYLQLAMTLAMNILGGKYTSIVAPTNVWFLIALFVAMSPSMWSSQPNVVEIYITILLGNGILIITITGIRPEDTYLTWISRIIAWVFWTIYTTVYWWRVLPKSSTGQSSGCGPYGWMFVQADLTNGSWLHSASKAFNIFSCIYCFEFLLFAGCQIPIIIYLLDGRIKVLQAQLGSLQTPQLQQLPSRWWILADCFTIFTVSEIGGLPKVTFLTKQMDYILEPFYKREALFETPLQILQRSIYLFNFKTTDTTEAAERRAMEFIAKKYHLSIDLPDNQPAQTDTGLSGLGGQPTSPNANNQLKSRLTQFLRVLWPYYIILLNISLFFYTVFAVEFTIAFNNIVDVNNIITAGQMIALVVSLGGCFAVMMAVWKSKREKTLHTEPNEASMGRDL